MTTATGAGAPSEGRAWLLLPTLPPMLAIAKVTILEASRRKLLIALFVLTVIVIGFTGWGFNKLWEITGSNNQQLGAVAVKGIASQLLILVVFMYSFALALSAALMAAPSVGGDVESGVALAMLSRPIRRSDYLLGKWLGMAIVIILYAVLSGGLELVVVNWVTGYMPPHPFQLLAYISAEGLVLLSLAVMLSTRLSGIAGGAVALFAFLMGWLAGVVGNIGQALQNSAIQSVGSWAHLMLPTDGLWRGAIWTMEPASVIAGLRAGGPGAASFPFAATDPPSAAYLAWCVLWVLAVLGLALFSFRRRGI